MDKLTESERRFWDRVFEIELQYITRSTTGVMRGVRGVEGRMHMAADHADLALKERRRSQSES